MNENSQFQQIEERFKTNPKTIYKIRDWNNPLHRKLITEQSIWFATPKSLNDPFDIRIPMKIDLSEVQHPDFKLMLKKSLILQYPNLTEDQLDTLCERRLMMIKKDPRNYFKKNYIDMREGATYDQVGIFSCTTDELSMLMWEQYGNNHEGFSVGFETFELFKNLQFLNGLVTYTNEIPFHSFLIKEPNFDFNDFFLKSTKWKHENEYRFFYVPFEKESDRTRKYTTECVTEFLLGAKFHESNRPGFINEVRNIFKRNIPIYQLKLSEDDNVLKKHRID